MSEEYNEGDWVLWECRNGVEIAARRTTVLADGVTWMCGNWLWYAGGRHTVAGLDHPFDLVKPLCILTAEATTEQHNRLVAELYDTHQQCGEAQRLLDEEREKTAVYLRELKDEQSRRITEKATLMGVIKHITGR